MPSLRSLLRLAAAIAAAAGLAAAGGRAAAREGVEVPPPSMASKFVSAEQVEGAAVQQYGQLLAEARSQNVLAPSGHPQLVRLRFIAERLIPHTYEWNPRARDWKWEINLIGSKQVNAFCMPGGKIAFFTGILEKLQLNDDEVAMIMGHEMTHALREHAREQMGKNAATRGAIEIGSAIFGLGNVGRAAAGLGGQLLTLHYGREDETEADLVGLELAARAGYDPRAGVTLWQKMSAMGGSSSTEWLSTHPASGTRIRDIEANIPKVEGLYERAPKPTRRFESPPKRAD
jgi:predicted Zn-dependent protease